MISDFGRNTRSKREWGNGNGKVTRKIWAQLFLLREDFGPERIPVLQSHGAEFGPYILRNDIIYKEANPDRPHKHAQRACSECSSIARWSLGVLRTPWFLLSTRVPCPEPSTYEIRFAFVKSLARCPSLRDIVVLAFKHRSDYITDSNLLTVHLWVLMSSLLFLCINASDPDVPSRISKIWKRKSMRKKKINCVLSPCSPWFLCHICITDGIFSRSRIIFFYNFFAVLSTFFRTIYKRFGFPTNCLTQIVLKKKNYIYIYMYIYYVCASVLFRIVLDPECLHICLIYPGRIRIRIRIRSGHLYHLFIQWN